MPYQITLDKLPAGYAATSSTKKGEPVTVSVREFISSENGMSFIDRLEGFPSDLIANLPPESNIKPSAIDHLLAIIRRDKTVEVYINELKPIAEIRPKRAIEAGEEVYKDDIVDILRLSFGDVKIPNDAGFVFIFSQGWRKGFLYDFVPLVDSDTTRGYDVEQFLGYCSAYLYNQHVFQLNESEWQILFDQGWFLFITLKESIKKAIVSQIKNQDQVDDMLNRIAAYVSNSVGDMLARWENNPHIQPHFEFIKHAVDKYVEQDYMSAITLLYPRIEGIMRTHHITSGSTQKAKQDNLIRSVLDARKSEQHEFTPLLPHKFRQFLTEVYFANFNPKSVPLSRHSIAHGVARPKDFSLKAATIGFLIVDQLYFFLP